MIQTSIVRRAIFAVENNTLYLRNSTLTLRARGFLTSLVSAPRARESMARLPLELSPSVKAAKISILTLLSHLLKRAMLWRTCTAFSSCPLNKRNLGDSWKRKTTKRIKKTARQIAPIIRSRYLHPMLLAFVQQASPVATFVQADSGLPSKPFPQEYLGIKAYARAEARTTPRGWNTDSIAKRKRRFFSISDQQKCISRVATYMWDELQAYRCVDGNISSNPETGEGREN